MVLHEQRGHKRNLKKKKITGCSRVVGRKVRDRTVTRKTRELYNKRVIFALFAEDIKFDRDPEVFKRCRHGNLDSDVDPRWLSRVLWCVGVAE